MRIILMTTFAIMFAVPQGRAQTSTQECYGISRSQGAGMILPILLNKCTGQTWVLTTTTLLDANSQQTNSYAFRWFPLAANTGEAVISK
jgi:hypothetical protein